MSQRLEGPHGWAARVDVALLAGHQPRAVDCWLVHAPNQALTGPWFLLGVVSLAPMPDARPAHLRYPQAQWEIWLVCLSEERGPRVDDPDTWTPLMPPNFVHQFHGATSEQVRTLCEAAATGIVDGVLPAETQVYAEIGDKPTMLFVQQLLDLWRSSVADTLEHLTTGGHASGPCGHEHGRLN